MAGKTAYTRKLNDLIKVHDSSVANTENAHRRTAMTRKLINSDIGDQSPSHSAGGPPEHIANARVPTLPQFRGERKDATMDAFYFVDHCNSLFEAYMLPKERWVAVMLMALKSC